jgi:hypothetical protein
MINTDSSFRVGLWVAFQISHLKTPTGAPIIRFISHSLSLKFYAMTTFSVHQTFPILLASIIYLFGVETQCVRPTRTVALPQTTVGPTKNLSRKRPINAAFQPCRPNHKQASPFLVVSAKTLRDEQEGSSRNLSEFPTQNACNNNHSPPARVCPNYSFSDSPSMSRSVLSSSSLSLCGSQDLGFIPVSLYLCQISCSTEFSVLC